MAVEAERKVGRILGLLALMTAVALGTVHAAQFWVVSGTAIATGDNVTVGDEIGQLSVCGGWVRKYQAINNSNSNKFYLHSDIVVTTTTFLVGSEGKSCAGYKKFFY